MEKTEKREPQVKPPRHPGGRPSLERGESKSIHVRLTEGQRAKYEKRGGAAWLRGLIDAA
jgi:hypothetical protein